MAQVARFSISHRRLTVVAWVIVLAVTLLGSRAIGSAYSESNSLKGTQSQRAHDLLSTQFPSQAGDTDQIVLHVSRGTLTAPAVQARATAMLAEVARLPHVATVISPYTRAGAVAVSRDGRTAFASVTFDETAGALPGQVIKRLISTALTARSSQLEVALGGQAVENVQGISIGPATVIGLIAAIVVLLITFGSVIAAGLPIITAMLGLGTGFGLIALGSRLIAMPDASTQLAAMIGLGVGIDYALFILTRFRESHRGGADIDSAVLEAMDTAGRAVLFAGITVIVALLGMVLLGVGFLIGLAVSSAIAVLMVMLAALTLLPALISSAGERIAGRGARDPRWHARRRRAVRLPAANSPAGASGPWARWAALVARRPWPAAIAGFAIMLAISMPALTLRLGLSDAGNDPAGTTTRQAYDLLAGGFGKGFNGPLQVVAALPHAGDQVALAQIEGALRVTPGVASISPPHVSRPGTTAVIRVFPRSAPQALATAHLVQSLRASVLPPVARATGTTLLVGGVTAGGIDFTQVLSAKLGLFIGIVVAVAAILLLLVFRSLVVPLQAAVMNLLSFGAALGTTVAIFQYGWLGDLLGVSPGPIEPWLPSILFAIVFGLSMDYEVFLISRIREEWQRRSDCSSAVVSGMACTGRVITAAATIMICVFLSFVFGADRIIKLFGLSLASAVFLDAFVIRSLVLPAVLELCGRATWHLPGWLGRRLPRVSVERPALGPITPIKPAPARANIAP